MYRVPTRGRATADARGDRVGYLFGSDAQAGLPPAGDSVFSSGNTDLLNLRPGEPRFQRLNVHRNYLRASLKHDLSGLGTIVNLITDPDLNSRVLAASDKLVKGFKGRVINPPRVVLGLGRDAVARRLSGAPALIAPATARLPGRSDRRVAIAAAGVAFPALLREVGSHSGATLRLVESADQAVAACEPGKTYYLTQYVDTRAPDGLFRKLRAFCFAGVWVLRHHLISDRWNIHASQRSRYMASRPALAAEEMAVVTAGFEGLHPAVRRALDLIRVRLGLDFFGVDFAVTPDARVVVFEANATMNFFPMNDYPDAAYLEPVRDKASAAIEAMLALRADGARAVANPAGSAIAAPSFSVVTD